MIFVKLKGGLGNQLFQYAAARQLAEKFEVPLKLDISFLTTETAFRTKREFELDKFTISASIASSDEIDRLKSESKRGIFSVFTVKERFYKLLIPFLQPKNDYYLSGYWQSEKYFDKIEQILRKELSFNDSLTGDYFTNLQHQIESTGSVSVHFRRGDYVANVKTNRHHGVCSLTYYQNAVKLLSEQLEDLQLFVFSDDIAWVKANFQADIPVIFVEKSDETQLSDFRLMSCCKHNIIANSSYSWWAAWLNPNKEKLIIAPQNWYRNKWKQLNAGNRVPKNWMRI